MKTVVWMFTLPAMSLALLGCYSLGTFAGHDEQIVPWEPTLTVEAPPPPAPAEPSRSASEPSVATATEPSSFAAKAVIPPPDIRLTAAPVTAASTPAAAPRPIQATSDRPSIPVIAAAEPENTAPGTIPTPTVSPEKVIADAAKIDSNSTRRSVYVAVAKRTDLGPNAQVRLVNDTYDNLLSETAMEEVFITLIQNPNFSPAAQHAILRRVDDFLNEAAKQRITAALTPK